MFVVLEGIDGAGTTHAGRSACAAHLRARRRLVHVTHEPSAGPIGAQIRLVLTQRISLPATHRAEAMALLFAADRLDHVEPRRSSRYLRDGYVVSRIATICRASPTSRSAPAAATRRRRERARSSGPAPRPSGSAS